MRIVVDSLPDSPRECLFSYVDPRDNLYVCSLRAYIEEADVKDTGYKPKCICKDVSRCEKLCVEML